MFDYIENSIKKKRFTALRKKISKKLVIDAPSPRTKANKLKKKTNFLSQKEKRKLLKKTNES